jgi:hypothetical protein
MLVASAAMSNIRSIWRFRKRKATQNGADHSLPVDFFTAISRLFFRPVIGLSCFSC